jgi:hypothetical protein
LGLLVVGYCCLSLVLWLVGDWLLVVVVGVVVLVGNDVVGAGVDEGCWSLVLVDDRCW